MQLSMTSLKICPFWRVWKLTAPSSEVFPALLFFAWKSKGQLISKCPFGFIVWTKKQRNYFWISVLSFFCSFLGASWKLFGLPGDLVCNIINKEAYRKPQKASMKPPGSYKKNSGQKSRNNFVGFLSKRWNQKDILKLTDL